MALVEIVGPQSGEGLAADSNLLMILNSAGEIAARASCCCRRCSCRLGAVVAVNCAFASLTRLTQFNCCSSGPFRPVGSLFWAPPAPIREVAAGRVYRGSVCIPDLVLIKKLARPVGPSSPDGALVLIAWRHFCQPLAQWLSANNSNNNGIITCSATRKLHSIGNNDNNNSLGAIGQQRWKERGPSWNNWTLKFKFLKH